MNTWTLSIMRAATPPWMLRRRQGLLALIFIAAASATSAQNAPGSSGDTWVYVAPNLGVMLEAPNAQQAGHILSGYTPLRVLTKTANMVKVRDVWGNIGWMKATDIRADARYVLSKLPVTIAYQSMAQNAAIAFEVTRDVALQALSFSNGWYKVRHYSGAVGYLPSDAVLRP